MSSSAAIANYGGKHLDNSQFIAQEIEKIYPELVKSSNLNYNRTHYKRVNYMELIPILVAQIQIMQTEIDELKRQMN